MLELSVVKLLHYGKYEDVYLSCDSVGNHYVVKRFYKQELENRKEYVTVNDSLTRKDWFNEFCCAVNIQLMIQHDRCVRCIHLYGLNPHTTDKSTLKDEIDMVLEWCECGSLMEFDNFSMAIPSFPLEVVKCITNDVLQALEYLSTINVAHCDIKPDNVFMDRTGRCKLEDFSHSQLINNDGTIRAAKGSYYFMAPEMASGSSDPYNGAAIDMWAMGISIWILYFRKYPYRNLSTAVIELMTEITNFDIDKELAYARRDGAHIDADFENFIRSGLCKEPALRITASDALRHPWLSNVNYEAAASYASSKLNYH